jgi:hypothetical protein
MGAVNEKSRREAYRKRRPALPELPRTQTQLVPSRLQSRVIAWEIAKDGKTAESRERLVVHAGGKFPDNRGKGRKSPASGSGGSVSGANKSELSAG